ncbi:SGNH/GDSL hydrolase family protein [Flavobacterium daemonense]|uniref:SGNH/GDSL hydrolase family protein n=1 Tax=Flavobacterium daemonense TaxID=1393049 RepID=UPI0013A681F2|nr:SGNH/GDSL hydrolase family protein [Flavobacterium daemonense]KAF2330627.1 SGNH/GDSL hydrolase family protein [Flavobacterium daemonense]
MGRVETSKDAAVFYWPGTSATINFTGTNIKATMKSSKEKGYFYAIIDNDATKALKFESDSIKKDILLAENLSKGKHSLQLYKLSNSTSANIFYGFEIGGKAKLFKPSVLPKRKIEFYGNSITAGHGVDVPQGMNDSGKPELFNNYYTYAALTARHFNAQSSIIARSGIGIMLSWFPEIMSEIYDRTDPFDPSKKWNFNNYTPDVVVINLFQNDSWLINKPEHQEFKQRFGTTKPTEDFIIKSYQNFVASIRAKYPKAYIICALGNMDATQPGSKWPGYIQQAVAGLKDEKIHTVFFPYKNRSGHPNREEQQSMADQLILFIDKTVKW